MFDFKEVAIARLLVANCSCKCRS